MSGDDLDGERAERTARTADELLSLALGSAPGDLGRALERVEGGEARDVLGAVMRELATLTAAQRLRDAAPADGEHAAAEVDDEELPADPWESGDATADALEAGRQLFEALVEQSVRRVLTALKALDESEVRAALLERVLAEMAYRTRPARGGGAVG